MTIADRMEAALLPLRTEVSKLRVVIEQLSQQLTIPSSSNSTRERAADSNDGPIGASAQTMACQVPDCPAPVLAKELCETHYRIMRRSLGSEEEFDLATQRPASAHKPSRSCSADDCDQAHYAKGLCRRHYMAERSRIRTSERSNVRPAAHVQQRDEAKKPPLPVAATVPLPLEEPPQVTGADNASGLEAMRSSESLRRELGGSHDPFDQPEPTSTTADGTLPTAEVVSRVVAQYRGGLDRVAEVLGRNKRTLIDLLDHLDLMPYVARVRGAERQRVEASPLRDRLTDLLFREKLLEDLGCLKEVDERAGFEIKMRCADLAKKYESVEEVLNAVAEEFRLEEAGMKRLIWRYDLRRHLRSQGLRSATQPRVRV